MRLIEKSWVWGPFKNSYTTIGDIVFYPKGTKQIPSSALKHEAIHIEQQKELGFLKMAWWLFKYVFCLPVLYNPFRYKVEMEAYMVGNKLPKYAAQQELKRSTHGFLYINIWLDGDK